MMMMMMMMIRKTKQSRITIIIKYFATLRKVEDYSLLFVQLYCNVIFHSERGCCTPNFVRNVSRQGVPLHYAGQIANSTLIFVGLILATVSKPN